MWLRKSFAQGFTSKFVPIEAMSIVIFSPGLGVPIMLASQAFRIGSLIVVGAIYFLRANIFGR